MMRHFFVTLLCSVPSLLFSQEEDPWKRKSWDVYIGGQGLKSPYAATVLREIAYHENFKNLYDAGEINRKITEDPNAGSALFKLNADHAFRRNAKAGFVKHLDFTLGVGLAIWPREAQNFRSFDSSANYYNRVSINVRTNRFSAAINTGLTAVTRAFGRKKFSLGIRNSFSPYSFGNMRASVTVVQFVDNHYYQFVNSSERPLRINTGVWNYLSANAGFIYNIDCKNNITVTYSYGLFSYRSGPQSHFSMGSGGIEIGANFIINDEDPTDIDKNVFW